MRAVQLSACCLGAVLVTACASATRHGDATLVDEKGVSFLPEPADHLDFPKTSLAKTGIHRYRVVSLPQVIYPHGLLLEVPEAEDLGPPAEHPWSRCIVRASLLTPEGRVFHTRTFRLGRDHRGSEPASRGHRSSFFPFTDYTLSGTARLPQYLSYVLQIEVLRPSMRASDALAVEAFTTVRPKET
jgi:hypothetical protein